MRTARTPLNAADKAEADMGRFKREEPRKDGNRGLLGEVARGSKLEIAKVYISKTEPGSNFPEPLAISTEAPFPN